MRPHPLGAPARAFGVHVLRAELASTSLTLAQVGVHDALDMPILDCALPLRASLLYENGLPVKQARLSPLHRDAIRG